MRLHGVRRPVEDNDVANAGTKDLIVPFCDGPQMQIATRAAREAAKLEVSTEFRHWNRYLLTLDCREFATGSDRSLGSCPSCTPPDTGPDHYDGGGAAVAA